jgi:formylglycine-generating enzyme required for sulfatase activity
MSYCNALTLAEDAAGRIPAGYQYRLPTEAEWEYMCRAGTTEEWNTGANLGTSQANFNNSYFSPVTVGSYGANAWGIFDMHGNVWEWCLDSWDSSANYPSFTVSDPYVSSGARRVVRGGGWTASAYVCRSAYRNSDLPDNGYDSLGFRVVLAPIIVP